jgi:hypothetical protein
MKEAVQQLQKEMKEQKEINIQINNKLTEQEGTLKIISNTQEKADAKRTIMHSDLGILKNKLGEHTLYLKNHVIWEEKNKKLEEENREKRSKIHTKYFKIALTMAGFIAISIISVIAWMFIVIMDTNGKQKAQEVDMKSIKKQIIEKSKSKDDIKAKQDKMHDDIKDIHHLIETKHNPIVEQAKEKRLDIMENYLNRNHGRITGLENNKGN